MELVLNTFETEPLPEPRETFIYANEPLLTQIIRLQLSKTL